MSTSIQQAIAISTAPAWRPTEPGDSITGTVIGFRTAEHEKYGKSPVVILANADGTDPVAVYLFHTMLKDAFFDLKPGVGEVVTVAYGGKRLKSGIDPAKAEDADHYHHFLLFPGEGPEEGGTVSTVAPW